MAWWVLMAAPPGPFSLGTVALDVAAFPETCCFSAWQARLPWLLGERRSSRLLGAFLGKQEEMTSSFPVVASRRSWGLLAVCPWSRLAASPCHPLLPPQREPLQPEV